MLSPTSSVIFDVTSASVCALLIIIRCLYRLLFRCRFHATCHRKWRMDDTYMTLALLPLVTRTVCIYLSFSLNPDQSAAYPTESEAAAYGTSVQQLAADRTLSRKLLLPSRITYALFLWCLKLSLLTFYSRLVEHVAWGKPVIRVLWWTIMLTFLGVLITTVAECRPLHLAWELAPDGKVPACSKALANLLTMAVFNIITDIALILVPFPILKAVRLNTRAKIQLAFLFGIGIVVVIITILRLPLILVQSVSQRSRSLWASVEILCACIVANAAFFYALKNDLSHRHNAQAPVSDQVSQRDMYLHRLPSTSGGPDERTKEHHAPSSTHLEILGGQLRASSENSDEDLGVGFDFRSHVERPRRSVGR